MIPVLTYHYSEVEREGRPPEEDRTGCERLMIGVTAGMLGMSEAEMPSRPTELEEGKEVFRPEIIVTRNGKRTKRVAFHQRIRFRTSR